MYKFGGDRVNEDVIFPNVRDGLLASEGGCPVGGVGVILVGV